MPRQRLEVMEASKDADPELLRELAREPRQVLDGQALDGVVLTGHPPDGFELFRGKGIIIPRKGWMQGVAVGIIIKGNGGAPNDCCWWTSCEAAEDPEMREAPERSRRLLS